MISKIDQRRLRDGAIAMALGEPKDVDEAKSTYDLLYIGAVALQSMDDLGSVEANRQAMVDCEELSDRMAKIKERWGL